MAMPWNDIIVILFSDHQVRKLKINNKIIKNTFGTKLLFVGCALKMECFSAAT